MGRRLLSTTTAAAATAAALVVISSAASASASSASAASENSLSTHRVGYGGARHHHRHRHGRRKNGGRRRSFCVDGGGNNGGERDEHGGGGSAYSVTIIRRRAAHVVEGGRATVTGTYPCRHHAGEDRAFDGRGRGRRGGVLPARGRESRGDAVGPTTGALLVVPPSGGVEVSATPPVLDPLRRPPGMVRDAIRTIPRGGGGGGRRGSGRGRAAAIGDVQAHHRADADGPPRSDGAGRGRGGASSSTAADGRDDAAAALGGADDSRVVVNLIRILYLTFYGSLGSLMPYLPVYYHSLGHDGLYIGLLGAVKPFTTFLVAPLWGIISDKTGRHHAILQSTFVTSLLLQLCVYLRTEVWFLVACGFLAALVNAPVKSLLDSMVMRSLPPGEKTNFGKLRLWGQLGFGLGSSGIGVMLSHTCGRDAMSTLPRFLRGYGVAFFVHGVLSIPALLCMKKFARYSEDDAEGGKRFQTDKVDRVGARNRKKRKKPSTMTTAKAKNKEHAAPGGGGAQIWNGLNLLVHNGDAMLFFFLVFVVGVSSGLIENFAYVRMREVGGTGKEMGLSRLVSSAAGVPMFWFSGPLTAMLGVDKILVLSILSYVMRFFIYAFMPTAYHGLPAEALRGLTFAAFWSTSTIYAHKISPPGMSATMLMFLNAMYGGLGQSMGAIIGGKLQSQYGTVKTFIYSGIFDLWFAAVLVFYLSMQRGNSSFRNPKPISKPTLVKDR